MKLDVIALAKEAGHRLNPAMIHELEAFAALVVEKCAKVADEAYATDHVLNAIHSLIGKEE